MSIDHRIKPSARVKGAAIACLFGLVLVGATACGAAESTDSSDVAQTEEGLGSCSTSLADGNHSGVGKCSGYLNTGTFRVTAVCCPYCNTTSYGNWAYLAGGTSKVKCGTTYATTLKIQYGPNTG
ncbi:MAG TPA: hypothetical protein VFK05_37660 [Polyangiaceae bacterium]|nr:hypothetical protein [Polyangiaceae bacterium]